MQNATQRGFTLLELMIALTVMGVLLAVGVPSFRDFTRNNRVLAAQNDLATALNVARSEALRRSRPVSVCASKDGTSCAASTDWINGWIVFTDRAGANAGAVDAGDKDEVLQRWEGSTSEVVMTGSQAFVQFLPNGMSGSAGTVTLTLAGKACTGTNKRQLEVTLSGALRSQKVSCP